MFSSALAQNEDLAELAEQNNSVFGSTLSQINTNIDICFRMMVPLSGSEPR